MTAIQNIIKSINSLSKNEFDQIRTFILEKDWEEWDRAVEQDSGAGNLDFLLQEAADEMQKNQLKPL